ncbi:MAG TPA: hypothetical protein ENN07_02280 [candidate division Zixibacteria bacterium]|nr:hypothetical protein [candidate division Zixibacteria bacterium]
MSNEPILKVTAPDGTVQEISIEQLCVSNHLTYQALIALLVKKGVVTQDELMQEVSRVQDQRLGQNE